MEELLRKVRAIADYQFGPGAGQALFPRMPSFVLSSQGKIRQIMEAGLRIASLRAQDGLLTLSIEGARRLHGFFSFPKWRVVVLDLAAEFVAQGRDVFAKHVIQVDPEIRPRDEVLVVDSSDRLLGTGQSLLSPEEMLSFKRGVAVKIRKGVDSD